MNLTQVRLRAYKALFDINPDQVALLSKTELAEAHEVADFYMNLHKTESSHGRE